MNELYDKIWNFLIVIIENLCTTYWGACIIFLISIKMIKNSLKRKETIETPYFILGWFSAIMGILLSIYIVISKILGKL